MSRTGTLRIGTSGYQYDHWKGRFYPETVPKNQWFKHYTRSFDTVEINNTFYNLPDHQRFDHWREEAPSDFLFALKFSRYGSHLKRLKDPEEPIARFVERAERLNSRLGPILVQLPGRWRANPERLENFLAAAPDQYRWVLEFRDPSWLCEEVYALLEKYQAALCVHDMLPRHPERLTANWTYWRFHGKEYTGSYSSQYLSAQAKKLRDYVQSGYDVYVYFNNDDEANAVRNAEDLRRYIDMD